MRSKRSRKKQKPFIAMLLLICLIAAVAAAKIFFYDNLGFSPVGEKDKNNVVTQNAAPASTTASPSPGSTAVRDWRLILVNSETPLPKGYTVEVRSLPNGLKFDSRAYDSLLSMLNDGKEQGLSFVVCSAYRSSELQTQLFEAQVAKQRKKGLSETEAVNIAKTIVAFPGTSEHQLGLAADIVALDYQVLDAGYAKTPEGKWLAEHAHEYGFILRYPADKEKITKIVYEPWHLRYVGPEHARKIKESGQCLEEYIPGLRI